MTDACSATHVSPAMGGHRHTCVGNHFANHYHWCGECKRWWFKDPDKKKIRKVRRPKRDDKTTP